MPTKPWYMSKVFWVNILAAIAIVAQAQWGAVISVETQAGILAAINLVLRLVTKEQVTW